MKQDAEFSEPKSRYYKLHNKERGVDLKIAPFGIWNTSDKKEAKEMLAACREYLEAIGLSHISESITLRDFDTNEDLFENDLQ